MREIGGYFEFEHYRGKMLHEDGIKLNCGRNCLAYLIEARGIKKILLPSFMCDSVFETCKKYGAKIRFYQIGWNLKPQHFELEDDEWLYITSYYGQLSDHELNYYAATYRRVIFDFSQDYFHEPVNNADSLYTCRKYFGVPGGAFLYTEAQWNGLTIEQDESFLNMDFVLGRFERSATEFYQASKVNNKRFRDEPIKWMSKLTENILRSINYADIERQRTENFCYLDEKLRQHNRLSLNLTKGPYAYPFMVKNAEKLRGYLINHSIFVPVLWPNLLENKETIDYHLANEILPIPCDQRYSIDEMNYIVNLIEKFYQDERGA